MTCTTVDSSQSPEPSHAEQVDTGHSPGMLQTSSCLRSFRPCMQES